MTMTWMIVAQELLFAVLEQQGGLLQDGLVVGKQFRFIFLLYSFLLNLVSLPPLYRPPTYRFISCISYPPKLPRPKRY